jgi:hypothetical protein
MLSLLGAPPLQLFPTHFQLAGRGWVGSHGSPQAPHQVMPTHPPGPTGGYGGLPLSLEQIPRVDLGVAWGHAVFRHPVLDTAPHGCLTTFVARALPVSHILESVQLWLLSVSLTRETYK